MDNRTMGLFASSHKILCAFCKLPHRVYGKNEVTLFDVAVLLLVSGLFAFLIWGEPDVRSLLIFMSLAFLLQVFVRVRWRESVKCPHCGFDPVLYKSNSEAAALKVKTFLDNRRDNPQFMLRPQPKIAPLRVRTEKSLAPFLSQNEMTDNSPQL